MALKETFKILSVLIRSKIKLPKEFQKIIGLNIYLWFYFFSIIQLLVELNNEKLVVDKRLLKKKIHYYSLTRR